MTTNDILRLRCWPTFLAIFAAFFVFSSSCQAGFIEVNQSIDDTYGDAVTGFKPLYLPTDGVWKDRTCSDCVILPNPSKASNGTWTAATYKPELNNINITLSFAGVAVWVFFILSNPDMAGDGIIRNTRCNFTLDNLHAGSFVHAPVANTTELIYNATVFSKTDLENTNHTLVISPSDPTSSTYINFDYATYTIVKNTSTPRTLEAFTSSPIMLPPNTSSSTGTPSPTSSKTSAKPSPAAGPIIGAVLGSLAIIIIVLLLLYRRYSRYRTKLISESPELEPFRYSRRVSHRSDPFGLSSSSASDSRPRPTSALHPLARILPAQFRGEKFQERLRTERQRDIDTRLRSARLEMVTLTSDNSILPPSSTNRTSPEHAEVMEALREQVRALTQKIERLEQVKQSDWAMGRSDKRPLA